MGEVIDEARKMYVERLPWWNLSLIRDLEQRSDGLGYEWDERCVRKLLPDIETAKKAELLADLDDLGRFRSRPASLDEFFQRAREIWYRPNRDLAQTAVSNLYYVAGSHHHPEINKSLMNLGAPVYLLIEASSDPERHLNTCFEEYTALVESTRPASDEL